MIQVQNDKNDILSNMQILFSNFYIIIYVGVSLYREHETRKEIIKVENRLRGGNQRVKITHVGT